ncbi:MAG TPA: MerC domain-containing protein [Sphingomicrobium sp.]|nr:MerC domain-containing protein [Sphingomicrobium sp.]
MLFYIVGNVTQLSIPTDRLDRIAMGLSGLCLVHCVATAVLLGLLSAAGGFLGAPIIHEVGLTLAMLVGAFALGRGILEHGFMMPSAIGALGLGVMAGALTLPHDGSEALFTVTGVMILALGHRLNVLAAD